MVPIVSPVVCPRVRFSEAAIDPISGAAEIMTIVVHAVAMQSVASTNQRYFGYAIVSISEPP
jgi:hypothetical protein